MAEADDLDAALDRVWEHQQVAAADLARGLAEHQAYRDFESALKVAALQLGKEAVLDALPFLQLALKLAVAAA